eukprot:2239874-Rhodomonas_salina.3
MLRPLSLWSNRSKSSGENAGKVDACDCVRLKRNCARTPSLGRSRRSPSPKREVFGGRQRGSGKAKSRSPRRRKSSFGLASLRAGGSSARAVPDVHFVIFALWKRRKTWNRGPSIEGACGQTLNPFFFYQYGAHKEIRQRRAMMRDGADKREEAGRERDQESQRAVERGERRKTAARDAAWQYRGGGGLEREDIYVGGQ